MTDPSPSSLRAAGLVHVAGAVRRFGPRVALDGVDLELGPGEIAGLVGPNGSGKTTLLELVAGLSRPDGGEVRVFGLDPWRDRRLVMREARFAFAPPALFDALTAREHIVHLCAIGVTAGERPSRAQVDGALETVGLADRADDRVGAFSLGMRQRLVLAQALLPRPRLLVLDEPADGLDPLAVLELRAVLLRLCDEHSVAILLSSHLLIEVEELVDHLLVLSEGRAIFRGRPEELLAESERLVLATDDAERTQGILAARGIAAVRGGDGKGGSDGELTLAVGAVALGEAHELLRAAGVHLAGYRIERPTLETALLERLREARGIRRQSNSSPHRAMVLREARVLRGEVKNWTGAVFLESLRLLRSRRPLAAVASLALFLALMLVGFYTYAETQTRGDTEFRYTFENSSYFNGLTFALYAFYFGFLLLLPIYAATEGGAQLAGDTHSGVSKLVLSRPITRTRLFCAKFALAAGFTATLSGAFLASALAIGLFAVGWGDLDLYPGVLQMTNLHQHLEQASAMTRFLLVWPASSFALLAPLALAFLVSAWSRSPVNAVGTSVALYLVSYVVSEIHFFAELRPWLFTSHLAFWRGLFREEVDWAALARDAAKLAGFTALFLALALRRFRTREER